MERTTARYVFASKAIEAFPRQTVTLASPQRACRQARHTSLRKPSNRFRVCGNCVILKVTTHNPLQPHASDRHRFVTPRRNHITSQVRLAIGLRFQHALPSRYAACSTHTSTPLHSAPD